MACVNRQWLLARRPQGMVSAADFEYREAPVPDRDLLPGEVLLRGLVVLCAPTMRNRMNAEGNVQSPMALGKPVPAPTIAQVVKSAHAGFPAGARVLSMVGWRDFAIVDAGRPEIGLRIVPKDMSAVDAIGLYGVNTLAAYFGLLRIGAPKPGDTLVVSGAAGSTGSMAAQIGRIHGCRVVGIAGGRMKCDWLRDDCGLDAVIDYKAEAVASRLEELCPAGVDVFFDNVGGEILQAALNHMAVGGRIVLCGQIAGYNGNGDEGPGLRNLMRLVYGRVRMQGFVVGDYLDQAEAAIAELRRWVAEGRLLHRNDIRIGFETIPDAFTALFFGGNNGTSLVKIADPVVD